MFNNLKTVAHELKPYYPEYFVYKQVFAIDKDNYNMLEYFDEMSKLNSTFFDKTFSFIAEGLQ